MIGRLCIIGVGLLGGSVARAARQYGLAREIVGVDSNPANLEAALRLGVVDRAYEFIQPAAEGADWVVLATPVGTMPALLYDLRACWNRAAIYTDVGSTKCNLIAALKGIFGDIPDNFIPGHPIAGAEQSGVEAARADLFTGKRVILTPVAATSPGALAEVSSFWRGVGASVSMMEPERHDQILAATSHLPHVLAFALTDLLGQKDEQEAIFQFAAGGFRDFSRIASSDPKMWLDICLANREQLLPLIEEYCASLSAMRELMAHQSADELLALFTRARAARQRFLSISQDAGTASVASDFSPQAIQGDAHKNAG